MKIYLLGCLAGAAAFVVYVVAVAVPRGDDLTIAVCAVGAVGALRLAYLAKRQMPGR